MKDIYIFLFGKKMLDAFNSSNNLWTYCDNFSEAYKSLSCRKDKEKYIVHCTTKELNNSRDVYKKHIQVVKIYDNEHIARYISLL